MLRIRLIVLVAVSLAAALAAFAVLVDSLFVRLEMRQLEALVQREALQTAERFSASNVGARLLEDLPGEVTVQFVDRAGRVVLPSGETDALPLRSDPGRALGSGERSWFVTSVPWVLPSGVELGTIRVGQDLAFLAAARATLLRALAVGGVAIAVVAMAVTLWLLGRSLAPLERLVREAEAIDPAHPELKVQFATDQRADEVGTLARALSGSLDAIRLRQQSERDALAEVAHELAAPLSVVAGRLRGVEARDPSPEIRAAREAADELLHTSRDLLTLARGELERVIEHEVVDLAEVVRGVAAETPFVSVTAGDAVEVIGSAERLRQAVRNLIRNALAASGDGAEVSVTVTVDGQDAVVLVLDRGPGLAVGEEEDVFERHRSRRSGGTGLGLSVTRTIVHAHEGRVTARQRVGGGAAFEVRLPTLASRIEDDEVQPETRSAGAGARTGGSDPAGTADSSSVLP